MQQFRTLLPLYPPPHQNPDSEGAIQESCFLPPCKLSTQGKVQESKAKCSASFGLCPHHSFIVVPASTASCPTQVWWPRFPPVREERGTFGCVWAPCVTTPAQEAREWVCNGDFQRYIPVERNFSKCGTGPCFTASITFQKALHTA